MNKTNWNNSGTPANATWSRTGGIDSVTTTYDDSTVSYDSSIIYYDGYDATTITTEDVKFDSWTSAQTPSNAAWTDIT